MPTGFYIRTKEHRELKRKIALERNYGKWMLGRKRELCPNWKGGYKGICIDCGEPTCSKKYQRCLTCSNKFHKNILKVSRLSGEKSHNWKGGITSKNHIIRNSIEYEFWRMAVFT